MKYFIGIGISFCYLLIPSLIFSQTQKDSVLPIASLHNCIQYALSHQPLMQQALIDEDITEKVIHSKLADGYPQLGFNYNFQHNFQLPTAYFSGSYIPSGTNNTANLGLSASQNIFNKDILLASRTAKDVRKQAKENTETNKIEVSVNVSKAFFDVLLTEKQVAVFEEAVTRLERSYKDAFNQYQSGLVDKTDYKRAAIALNNAKAQRKQTQDLVVAKNVYLKELMGYPDSLSLRLIYDSAALETEAFVDTAQSVQYTSRIEFQLLQTQKKLQQSNLKYYKWNFLPTASAFGNYNLGYLNNDFGKTFSQNFNNSNVGIQLSLSLFQGSKRVYQLKQAELQLKRLDYDELLLKSRIQTQYVQAITMYKANLASYNALKENVQLADEVYKTIRLQYTAGIKAYLEVIIAESDLHTAQLNFYNALFQLLQSKIDVQRALGHTQF